MRILIADDNRFSRELIKSVLEEFGICVCTEDGVQALNEFKTAFTSGNPFDLVCLDIRMPRMNGQEVLCKIREFEKEQGVSCSKKVAISMITALDDEKNISEAFCSGKAVSYITKPLTRDKLIGELTLYGILS